MLIFESNSELEYFLNNSSVDESSKLEKSASFIDNSSRAFFVERSRSSFNEKKVETGNSKNRLRLSVLRAAEKVSASIAATDQAYSQSIVLYRQSGIWI